MEDIKKINIVKRKYSPVLLLLLFLIVALAACSSGEDSIEYSFNKDNYYKTHRDFENSGPNKFSFKENGDWYKVKLKDGEIKKLYINGDRIDEDEFYKYEDLVFEKRNEVNDSYADYDGDWDNFHRDMDEIRIEVSKEVRDAMREVRRELRNVDHKKFRADINLDELHENLAHLKNMRFEFDDDEFNRSMEELADNMSNIRVELDDHDWSDFREGMRSLKDELRNLDIDMGDLKIEMKKLKRFMKDFRRELIDDGYLEYGDDDFDVEFNENELIINGTKIPDSLLPKYKEMYKEHFGRELDDDFRYVN